MSSAMAAGLCVNSCPMDVIRMDEEAEKAIIRYPEDCMMLHDVARKFIIDT